MSVSILDLMKPEEREKALKRAEKRRKNLEYKPGIKVSPEIYTLAEFGYYYGYDAIKAIRNNEITLDEVDVILEGARKVWYSKLIEQAHANVVANQAARSEKASSAFESGMKPFEDRAKVEQ